MAEIDRSPLLSPLYISDEWKMWNDHLAGFDERQKKRSEMPNSVVNKLRVGGEADIVRTLS